MLDNDNGTNLVQERPETAQDRFEDKYVTSAELMDVTGVTRPAVIAKMNKRFQGVKVGNTYVWERTEELSLYVEAWLVLRG